MQIKKFVADNMTQVMALVKKEMGNEAIILQTKKAKTKGVLGFFKVIGAPGFEPGTFCTPRGEEQITQRPDIAEYRRTAWGCASPHITHMTHKTQSEMIQSPPNRHFSRSAPSLN